MEELEPVVADKEMVVNRGSPIHLTNKTTWHDVVPINGNSFT